MVAGGARRSAAKVSVCGSSSAPGARRGRPVLELGEPGGALGVLVDRPGVAAQRGRYRSEPDVAGRPSPRSSMTIRHETASIRRWWATSSSRPCRCAPRSNHTACEHHAGLGVEPVGRGIGFRGDRGRAAWSSSQPTASIWRSRNGFPGRGFQGPQHGCRAVQPQSQRVVARQQRVDGRLEPLGGRADRACATARLWFSRATVPPSSARRCTIGVSMTSPRSGPGSSCVSGCGCCDPGGLGERGRGARGEHLLRRDPQPWPAGAVHQLDGDDAVAPMVKKSSSTPTAAAEDLGAQRGEHAGRTVRRR